MGKIFKTGLLALAPVVISIAIILWIFSFLEDIFRVPLEWLLGNYYYPGMGVALAIIIIFFVGVLVNNYLIQKFTRIFDRLFAKIPFFKIIYNAVRDMLAYFKPSSPTDKGNMVIVEVAGMRFLGLLTRENLPEALEEEGHVCVYIPLSYQIGGFTATVPKEMVEPVDMTVEEGMRFIVTAGLLNNGKKAKG